MTATDPRAADELDVCETGCVARVQPFRVDDRWSLWEVIGCVHIPGPCRLIWAEHTPAECQKRRRALEAVERALDGVLGSVS